MNDLVEEMRTYYARRAPSYDTSMGYDDPQVVESLAPVAESYCRQLAGRQLLEIACGPAFWTRVVSRVATSIVATDCNDSVLEQAWLKQLDPSVVSFAIADAYDLSTVAGTFDGAFATDWLAHVPRLRVHAFLDGLHRRLEPGARVAFCDQTPGRDSMTRLRDDEGNHLQERELPDGSRYRVIKHFWSDDEFRAVFAPWTADVSIERFNGCRRVVVGYSLR